MPYASSAHEDDSAGKEATANAIDDSYDVQRVMQACNNCSLNKEEIGIKWSLTCSSVTLIDESARLYQPTSQSLTLA